MSTRNVPVSTDRDNDRTETQPPKVGIVVLNWDRLDETLKCLDSVCNIEYPNLEVMLVDNHSRENPTAAVEKEFPEIKIIRNEANLGYAGGNNVGIREGLRTGCDYVILLNNDAFPEPDMVAEMVRKATSDDRIAAVGGKVLWTERPNTLWAVYAWETFNANIVTVEGLIDEDRGQYEKCRDVHVVVGCALMLRREALEDVGLLDETFFAYHEDLDWCRRARDKGYRVVYVPTAVLYHRGSASTGGGPDSPIMYFGGRNSVLYAKKHATASQWLKFLLFLCYDLIRSSIRSLVRRKPRGVLLKMRGVVDGFLGREPPLAKLGLDS